MAWAIIGSGGREHALCWHLKKNKIPVVCAPGSDAIKREFQTFNFKNFDELKKQLNDRGIINVIIGPEKYLAEGIADALGDSFFVFGPSQSAARLESDKSWAKEFLNRHQIPTARSEVVKTEEEFLHALKNFKAPYVVKASGLAAGKGVWIGSDESEGLQFARDALKNYERLVIEDFLPGEELSYFVAVDGDRICSLGAAQDHKRLLENDEGPNTGGMGAYSPVPLLTDALKKQIDAEIVRPTINGLKNDGIYYRGFIFIGLMVVKDKPYVLEFNCRLGDPEAQALLYRLKTPLTDVILSLKENRDVSVQFEDGVSLNIVIAAQGYPDFPKAGFTLSHIETTPNDIQIFHSGTKLEGGAWKATGGRLISVVSRKSSLLECQSTIYPWIESLDFLDNVTYRRDIGVKAYRHLRTN